MEDCELLNLTITSFQAKYLRRKLHELAKQKKSLSKRRDISLEASKRAWEDHVMLDGISEYLKYKLET